MVRAEVKALHRHYEHKATHTLLQIPQKVFRRFTANVRYFLFIGPLLFFTETILAQPPGLPDSPDQAPLGGLGLLAAAGGAYAWKKLKGTKAH
ncbi:MAG: hypothetical protein LAT57_05270 [Balneolales bacterium]|nr:hypothetical protein [Balneolales bacterium]